MTSVWALVLAAPPVAVLLIMYAVRPAGPVVAPTRLAAVRSALIVGSFAVLVIEVASAMRAVTGPVIGGTWLAGLAAAAALAAQRWRREQAELGRAGTAPIGVAAGLRGLGHRCLSGVRQGWREASRADRALGLTVVGLVLAELVVAVLAEPNNYDSYTYHLPRIERWVWQGSVEFFPTNIHRQVTLPPGAEYLLAHLRLLTGTDATYNLLQWCAGVGCLVVATRIVAQFGGGRRAQLLTAFLVGTTPMVVMQASSTQTDLVTAAWVGCAATLALDGLHRRARTSDVLALGAATGLTAVTKTNGLLGVAPLLVLWGVAQLRLGWPAARRLGTTVIASLGLLAVAAVLVGPFTARIVDEFEHPLGPPRLRDSVPMQRHDPGAILINALRVAHTALDTPVAPLRGATVRGIGAIAAAVGVDPQDRQITFGVTQFPEPSWHPDEDRVAFPLVGTLCLIAVALALVAPGRVTPRWPGSLRAYAVAVAAAGLLFVSTIKWQPWGNRLLVFVVVLAAPVAGLWLADLFDRMRGRRSLAAVTASIMLATAALAGVLTVGYGFPRRLVGTGSVFTTDEWDTRFLRRPQWQPDFRWAAEQVSAPGRHRIGVVQQANNWEYPWWLLLPGREIVPLQSVLPHHPPDPPTSVDAIICSGEEHVCEQFVPDDWRLHFVGYTGYALPPPPPRPSPGHGGRRRLKHRLRPAHGEWLAHDLLLVDATPLPCGTIAGITRSRRGVGLGDVLLAGSGIQPEVLPHCEAVCGWRLVGFGLRLGVGVLLEAAGWVPPGQRGEVPGDVGVFFADGAGSGFGQLAQP